MSAKDLASLTALGLCLALSPVAPAAGSVVDLADADVRVLNGDEEQAQFGYSIATGDIDGDGSLELVVGAPGRADTSDAMHVGAVYVFRVATVETLSAPADASGAANRIIRGMWPRGRFGSSLAIADIDGDGIDDLAVGAPTAGEGEDLSAGVVAVYLGAGDALAGSDTEHATPDIVITGVWSGGRFGSEISEGDLDGDGAAELIVSAPRAGAVGGRGPGIVYVFSQGSIGAARGSVSVREVAEARVRGEKPGDSLTGIAIADSDGDGDRELVLGAYSADGDGPELVDAGRVYVVPVHDLLEAESLALPRGASLTVDGRTTRAYFGRSISSGDVDYDGTDDVLVSAYASKKEQTKVEASGEAFVLFGSDDGLIAWPGSDEAPTFRSRGRWDLFGLPVLLTDLNGDASCDLVIAAQFADGPDGDRDDCGEIYVFWGSLRSVITAKAGAPELADRIFVGAREGDRTGGAVKATNLFGSRSLELIVGAPDSSGESETAAPGYGRVVVIPGELSSR